jgi:hypothetical protein
MARRPNIGIHICARCGTTIRATSADPVISAPSLGKGFYHSVCADRQWQGSTDTSPPSQDAIDEIAELALGILNED